MQNIHYFKSTRKKLFEIFDQVNTQAKYFFNSGISIDEFPSNKDQEDIIYCLKEICSINQILINTLEKTKIEINQGKLNNPKDYFESDLIIVDVVLRIYLEFSKNKPCLFINCEAQDIKQIFLLQMEKLFNEITRFPEDLASNVKNAPGTITTIHLDYYQLIYMALNHINLKFLDLQLNKTIQESLKRKKPKKEKQM